MSSSVGLLGHNVGSWGGPFVRGLRRINAQVSFRSLDSEVGSGTLGLGLSPRSVQIDIRSLPDLLDLRSLIVGPWSLCLSYTSAERNLRALVSKLRSELINIGSLELVGESGAIDTEAAAFRSVVEARTVDTKRSLGSVDTERGFGALETVVNSGSLVRERPV